MDIMIRAVGRSENPEVAKLFGGNNLPPLVEIVLTDLQKSGGAMAPLAPTGTTGLVINTFEFENILKLEKNKVHIF